MGTSFCHSLNPKKQLTLRFAGRHGHFVVDPEVVAMRPIGAFFMAAIFAQLVTEREIFSLVICLEDCCKVRICEKASTVIIRCPLLESSLGDRS